MVRRWRSGSVCRCRRSPLTVASPTSELTAIKSVS
jgi:hypothetical protein